MYLTLEQIKKHLNIDAVYTGDDAYLTHLLTVAEKVVEKHIDNNLEELANGNGGVLPPPLSHAILLFIGDMYLSRESVAFTTAVEIPKSFDYILSLYKNYNNTKHNV